MTGDLVLVTRMTLSLPVTVTLTGLARIILFFFETGCYDVDWKKVNGKLLDVNDPRT